MQREDESLEDPEREGEVTRDKRQDRRENCPEWKREDKNVTGDESCDSERVMGLGEPGLAGDSKGETRTSTPQEMNRTEMKWKGYTDQK